MKELTKVLEIVKQRIFEKHGISIEIPLTKSSLAILIPTHRFTLAAGMVSVSRKHWDEYTDLEPFLKNWMQVCSLYFPQMHLLIIDGAQRS